MKFFLSHLLILFILFVIWFPVTGQELSGFKNLYDKIRITELKSPDSSFYLIDQKLREALQNGDSTTIAFLYLEKGVFYFRRDQDLATSYLFKAKELFKKTGNNKYFAIAQRILGGLDQFELNERVDLLKKAIPISQKANDIENIFDLNLNLGVAYVENGFYDSASVYFEKCKKLLLKNPSPVKEASLYNNISVRDIMTENYESALKHLHKGLKLVPQPDRDGIFLSIQANLMTVYTHLNIPDSMFYYQSIIRQHFPERPKLELQSLLNLMNYYEKNNDIAKALQYSKIIVCINEEQLKESKANTLNLVKLEYKSQLKEEQLARLNTQMEKALYMRASLVIILVLVLLFAVIIIYFQKQKARKKREAQQQLMEAHLQNSELKRKYLHDELNYTNKELTSFATTIVENHNILGDLKTKISQISKERSVREMREQLKDLHVMLQQIFQNNIHRQEFLKRSKELNYSLVFHLKTTYEQLSDSDINILILMFLKFSSKEIAILYNIEPKSVEQRRRRLRHKLDMKKAESFDKFFDEALADMRTSGVSLTS